MSGQGDAWVKHNLRGGHSDGDHHHSEDDDDDGGYSDGDHHHSEDDDDDDDDGGHSDDDHHHSEDDDRQNNFMMMMVTSTGIFMNIKRMSRSCTLTVRNQHFLPKSV